GSGPATAKGGTVQTLTISPGVSNGQAKCYPGSPCDAVARVSNPNSALTITQITTPTSGGAGSTSDPACPASALSVNPQSGLSIPLAAGSSEVILPNAFSMDSQAPNACQGATFEVPLRLIARAG